MPILAADPDQQMMIYVGLGFVGFVLIGILFAMLYFVVRAAARDSRGVRR